LNKSEVFSELIETLKQVLHDGNTTGAWITCEDYNRYFSLADDVDALFISENLSTILHEYDRLVNRYEMSESVMSEFVHTISSYMDRMLVNYKNKEQLAMYVALRDTRAYMTRFEFTQWHTSKFKRAEIEDEV
jgi:hypothetical protein